MILTVAILLVVLLAFGLLLVPIQIFIDTDAAQYYVRIRGLARVSLEPDKKELLRIRFKTLFYERCFYPITTTSKPKPPKKKAKPKRRMKFGKIVRVIRSFQVRRFVLDMDTGDYTANAKMYPVFMLLNQYVASFHINFENRNRLLVDVRNRPYRILKSFVKH